MLQSQTLAFQIFIISHFVACSFASEVLVLLSGVTVVYGIRSVRSHWFHLMINII